MNSKGIFFSAFTAVFLGVAASETVLYLASNGRADLDFLIKKTKNTPNEQLREKKIADDLEWLKKQKTMEYFIKSNDGLTLRALYLPAKNDNGRIAFCVHGIKTYGEREFSTPAKYFYENGISCFIIDQRAHGKSEGKYVTYGYREAEDCVLWLYFITEKLRPDARIFLYGMSMGSSTVLLTNRYPLPSNVEYIVADCGYSSVKEQLKHIFSTTCFPAGLCYLLYKTACRVHHVYNPDKVDIIGAVRNSKIPIVFIHGDRDNVVPTENVHILFDACGSENKTLVIAEGAEHVQSFLLSEDVRNAVIAPFVR